MVYFYNPADTISLRENSINNYSDIQIQADDILSITVSSINPEATQIFNDQMATIRQANVSNGTGSVGSGIAGYLVGSNGQIDFPMIGHIAIAGLTTQQAKDTLSNRISKYLKNPIVNIRLQNFKVSVLGEVNHPATFNVPNEKITILEALSQAGDITIYGKRDNVMIIRENNGVRQIARVNLNGDKVFASPYYYLKQNDVVYIEPQKAKTGTSSDAFSRYLTFALPLVSVTSLLITILRK
jgi:polysaccharide biosynthesis/export protein